MNSSGKTILVAEDDPASRELLAEILRAAGYAVLEAADGAEAVGVLDRQRPDLVLMDIQMPRMSGFEVLDHLRHHLPPPPPPVLAITAHAMRGDREHALQSGFNDYLTKPIEVNHLRRRVQELLAAE